MPKLQKSKALQHLDTFRVFVDDPDAFYFQLRELDEVFHAGKNAFLIAGTEFLEPTTEVLVELIDVNGHSVFNQPIKNYAEGRSRVVSVEVYEDTPPGPAILTILGELRATQDGTPIPEAFQNAFNVRFQKRVTIDPGRFNTSVVRLFNPPTLAVTESLVPYRIAVTGSVIQMASGSVAGFTQRPSIDNATGLSNTYAIVVDQPFFSASMLGASFTASVPSGFFTSTLASILNDRTAYLADSYTSGGLFLPFLTSNYTVSFQTAPTFVATQYTRSYADLTLGPLTTFSGEVRRTRLFMKSLDSFGDFEPVGNVFVEPTDLMTVTTGETADPEVHIGQFLSQRVFDTYWQAHEFDSASNPLPVIVEYQTAQLMDAVHVANNFTYVINSSGSYVVTSNGDFVVTSVLGANTESTARYHFEANIPRQFKKDYEYMFDAVFLVRKSVGVEATVKVYLSGSAFPSLNPLGQLVTTLDVPLANTQRYFSLQDVAANIVALDNGPAAVTMLVQGGDWYIQNVSVTLANERGFNPDEVHLLVPVKNKRLENLQFKAEIYDLNNNAIPVTIESDPVFFVGENVYAQGRDDRIVGTITLAVSGSGPSLAVDNSGSFIGISSQSIAKPVAPANLSAYTGSPIITMYSGSIPFIDSLVGPAVGLQIMGGGAASASFLDFNTATGILTIRGDITLLPGTSLSQSIVSGSSGSDVALAQIQQLVSGTLIGGTYLTGNSIISPLIAGNTGYFSTQFGVGNIAGNQGIVLTALGYTASNLIPQSGSPAIYIGHGTFASVDTPFLVASSSFGAIMSLGTQFVATQSNGGLSIIISSSNFALSASGGGSTLLINPSSIALGNPVPTAHTGALAGAIGFYADRSGTFFVGSGTVDPVLGTGTGSWLSFNGSRLSIQSTNFLLSASNAGNTLLINTKQIQLGNPVPTAHTGSSGLGAVGLFVSGNGQFFVGSGTVDPVLGTGTGSWISFDGSRLSLQSTNFLLSASNAGNTLQLSTTKFLLGNPAPSSYTGSAAGAVGFFVSGSGQLFLGSGSMDPILKTGTGSWISFDGTNLNIQTPVLSVIPGSASFSGTVTADTLIVRGGSTLGGALSAVGQMMNIGTAQSSKLTSAPIVSASNPSNVAHVEMDRGDFIMYGWTPALSASSIASQSVLIGSFTAINAAINTTSSAQFSNVGTSTTAASYGSVYVSGTTKPSASVVVGANPAYNNVYTITGQMNLNGSIGSDVIDVGVCDGRITLEISFDGGTTWSNVTTLVEDSATSTPPGSSFNFTDNFSYNLTPATASANFLVRLVLWSRKKTFGPPGTITLNVSDNSGEQPVSWQYAVGTVSPRRGLKIFAQPSASVAIPSFNIEASPSASAQSASFLVGGDIWAEKTGSATGSTLYFFNGTNKIKLA